MSDFRKKHDNEDPFNENPLVDTFEEEDPQRKRHFDLVEDFYDEEEAEDDWEARDYRPIRGRRDSRLGCLGGVMYATFVISLSIILACLGWMAASDVLALNKASGVATVSLPTEIFTQRQLEVKDAQGNVTGSKTVTAADIDYVARELKDKGVIEYQWLFKLFAQVSKADVKLSPGTYQLRTDQDYRKLVKDMQVGTTAMEVTTLTFPEGYTMKQIFEKLEENGVCSAEKLYEAAAGFTYSFSFLENAESGQAIRLEGYLFPDTYDFYQGEQASSVINKFLSALHYRITADMLKQCENLGLSFREVVTIASMIEKEAADNSERGLIASVIYNRLRAGMPLGIDATILYEYPDYDGGVNIPQEILQANSPYNTGRNTGLPPTPICNPGIASVQAALKPEESGYYYYALDAESGKHRFFTNANDHAAFVATQNYDELS